MEYEECINYILKECKELDLNLLSKEHIIAEMKPKEEADV